MSSTHATGIAALAKTFVEIADDEVVYVGQSNNFTSRIGTHSQRFEFDRAFVVSVEEREALAVEGAFARRFNPRYVKRASDKEKHRDAEILARYGVDYCAASAGAFESRKDKGPSADGIRRTQAALKRWREHKRTWTDIGLKYSRDIDYEALKRQRLRRRLWLAVKPLLEAEAA